MRRSSAEQMREVEKEEFEGEEDDDSEEMND